MPQFDLQITTGLNALDRTLKGLMPGDNIVWQVAGIADYRAFVEPYYRRALAKEQPVIYFRFARHEALVEPVEGVQVHELHPEDGFEAFIAEIHSVIEQQGRGGYYVFDCLSDLAVDWYSDQMLGSFFMLTCPYLYDVEALAYFGLYRNHHSAHATMPISETTQIWMDVYNYERRIYVHPIKVQHRYSPTMHTLHVWDGEDIKPVTHSATISEVLNSAPWSAPSWSDQHAGVWDRTFLAAEEQLDRQAAQPATPPAETGHLFNRLLRMAISRDERVLDLAGQYLTLQDVLAIRKRMIGTGLIGGKSVGMLLARAILRRSEAKKWGRLLEPHDSFFVGSDVFYDFLVRNGVWWVRQLQKDAMMFLKGAERGRRGLLVGSFPDFLQQQFSNMLSYFGQSPMIVRSSSLLEDNFGNSFAGKYDSVFCANQGPRHRIMDDFFSAVKTVYASSMSEKALTYRCQRGLLDLDEQMALLIQRVSGSFFGPYFYPQIAGVGFSFNPYVWSKDIDPEAGMLRLVFGLGTRAVDRNDDDYTRVVALNAPDRRPEGDAEEVRRFSQRRVDLLDLEANHLSSRSFNDVVEHSAELDVEMFASRDAQAARRARERNLPAPTTRLLNFAKLFDETDFVADMREMLQILEDAYAYPVDVEFTANFVEKGRYRINLVQCRPFQFKGGGKIGAAPEVDRDRLVLRAQGAIIGQSRVTPIDRFIYVVPSVYGQLPVNDRYAIARLIGKLTHLDGPRPGSELPAVMLLGPGRWGTTTPSLGVPIRFSDINTISVLCEIVAMRDDLVPDVSLGTHLFSELVEMDILYLALFPHREENQLNEEFFTSAPNKLAHLLPDEAKWAQTVRVVDPADLPHAPTIKLHADILQQKVLCYRDGA